MSKDNEKLESLTETSSFIKALREFALTVGEDCPEGHRRDPASGRCLPMGGQDHTAYTRSVNDEQGPEWRGEVDRKDDDQMLSSTDTEVAVDADEMDSPESCAEGTTFSFVQRQCISIDDAEAEDVEEFARDESEDPIEEEVEGAAAPGMGGHPEITLMQPEGRRDTVNHDCPPNTMFDYILRECIPLNKDTVMASDLSEEFKQAVATYARIAVTVPDPLDGHKHVATLDEKGNGITSVATLYAAESCSHSHDIAAFVVKDHKCSGNSISMHPGVAVPVEHHLEPTDYGTDTPVETEAAAKITTTQRKSLPDSAFGVPGKRKFPLDTCGRVRNAMARFNQAKGLTSGEKATLRRKILARAKACGIKVESFAKATTDAEFAQVMDELRRAVASEQKAIIEERYAASEEAEETEEYRGPCPPGMVWDAEQKRCGRTQGFVDQVKANHSEIVMKQPVGRRDTVGHQCPAGQFFDYVMRRCLPLDPSQKEGTTTEKAQRDLTAQPKGRPVRLSTDCPKDTIWNKDRNECIPLDSSKKTKSEEEDAGIPPQFLKNIKKKKGKDGDDKKGKKGKDGKDGKKLPPWMNKKGKSEEEEEEEAQTTAVGPGKEKDDHGCDTATETYDVEKKKCVKSRTAKADAIPSNREGLTPPPAGKVQHQSDCPPNTAWDSKMKICRPIDSTDKDRPFGASPQAPKSTADEVEELTPARLIQELDRILSEQTENKEKSRIAAKDLPNAAFPPSTISATKRALMHHTPNVEDPYDNASVDVGRLRNALARSSKVEGFSEKAVEDALEHLLYHAREAILAAREKKE